MKNQCVKRKPLPVANNINNVAGIERAIIFLKNTAFAFPSQPTIVKVMPSSLVLHEQYFTDSKLCGILRDMGVVGFRIIKRHGEQKVLEELQKLFEYVFDTDENAVAALMKASIVLEKLPQTEEAKNPQLNLIDDLLTVDRTSLDPETCGILGNIDQLLWDLNGNRRAIIEAIQTIKIKGKPIPFFVAEGLFGRGLIIERIIKMIDFCRWQGGRFSISNASQMALTKNPEGAFKKAIEIVEMQGSSKNKIFSAAQATEIATSKNPPATLTFVLSIMELTDERKEFIFNAAQAVQIAISQNPEGAKQDALDAYNWIDSLGCRCFNASQATRLATARDFTASVVIAVDILELRGEDKKRLFSPSQAITIATSSNPGESKEIALGLMRKNVQGERVFDAAQATKIATSRKPRELSGAISVIMQLEDEGKNLLFNSAQAVQIATAKNPSHALNLVLSLLGKKIGEERMFTPAQAIKIANSKDPEKAEKIHLDIIKLRDKAGNKIFTSSQAADIASSSNPDVSLEIALRILRIVDVKGNCVFNAAQAISIVTAKNPEEALRLSQELLTEEKLAQLSLTVVQAVDIATSNNSRVALSRTLKIINLKGDGGEKIFSVKQAIAIATSSNPSLVEGAVLALVKFYDPGEALSIALSPKMEEVLISHGIKLGESEEE